MESIEETIKEVDSILREANNPNIQKFKNTPLVQYLVQQMVYRLLPTFTGGRPPWKEIGNYVCMEHFVLVNGNYYSGVRLGKFYKLGEIKHCYDNSREALLEYPGLTYIEGYVTSLIPIAHAWNIDGNSDVVELTLREKYSPVKERSYFGVSFDTEYVLETGGSLIDDWRNDWPLLRDAKLAKAVIIPPIESN